MKSYYYKGFMIAHGLCESHPNSWHVMDWRNYDETIGAKSTNICASSIALAKQAINQQLFIEQNIPF